LNLIFALFTPFLPPHHGTDFVSQFNLSRAWYLSSGIFRPKRKERYFCL